MGARSAAVGGPDPVPQRLGVHPEITGDRLDRRSRPRPVQRDGVRLELGGVVLHPHGDSVLLDHQDPSVSGVQNWGQGPAGRPRRSVPPRPRTGGHGSWSSPTPSSVSPGHWLQTSAAPGGSRPGPNVSPRPGSAGGSGTSELTCSARPVFPNPAAPAPDDHPASRTSTGHPATTSARPSNALRPSRPSADLEDLGR